MNTVEDVIFSNVRKKLDILGYSQSLPITAVPLVTALLDDLVKTTESLRDAKRKMFELLEEKSFWELGAEPYKCDNTRLTEECNQLHLQIIKERDDYDKRASDFLQKLRNLESDKSQLEEQCEELQHQLRTFLLHQKGSADNLKNNNGLLKKQKKPFITVVRGGEKYSSAHPAFDMGSNLKCFRCTTQSVDPQSAKGSTMPKTLSCLKSCRLEIEKLENNIKDLTEELALHQRKIDMRDREIRRLSVLLNGGRALRDLARDCCYKDVKVLSDDIKILQNEKSEYINKIRKYQDQMHEAMQRAVNLEIQNKQFFQEMYELKRAALQVEEEANEEIAKREEDIKKLQIEQKQQDEEKLVLRKDEDLIDDRISPKGSETLESNCQWPKDKRELYERINELTQKESELTVYNQHLQKKIEKMKIKLQAKNKEMQDNINNQQDRLNEEKIRLKAERDFFQKEYLRFIHKSTSDEEIKLLHSQIATKDNEIHVLRSELCRRQEVLSTAYEPSLLRSLNSDNIPNCVEAAILRSGRERDCAHAKLERMRSDRDTLQEKNLYQTQKLTEETQKYHNVLSDLNDRLKNFERENRDLKSSQFSTETHIVLLKQERDKLKENILYLQEENCKLKTFNTQLKNLQEQTERSLLNYQNKLSIAEQQLKTSNSQKNNLNEYECCDNTTLEAELKDLKHTFTEMEKEKDAVIAQLDAKTEQILQLQRKLSVCHDKHTDFERDKLNLEKQVEIQNHKIRDMELKLSSKQLEIETLQEKGIALQINRDGVISENWRATNDLAECQAEILMLEKKLRDSEDEIERLKQQLQKYVQEVKKAEDLLLLKEKEREEMLEYYRSLSHDAIALEGNNQSLESEAAEHKRHISELQAEIDSLRKEVNCRNSIIEDLEEKVSGLNLINTCLQSKVEEAMDAQKLLKEDVDARTELCEKLDVEKEKLNAEITELNGILQKVVSGNEELRNELAREAKGQNMSIEAFEELLAKTRSDLEEQITVDRKLKHELDRLRHQNENLLRDLTNEREKRKQKESLAKEFEIQNQELRHNLTDDRFREARSREQSPRTLTRTM